MKALNQLVIFLAVATTPSTSLANHGPATSGGGANTQSGETIKRGSLLFSIDGLYTRYEGLSPQQLDAYAVRAGTFDALSDAFLTSATLSYGVTNDFQIDTSLGWYSGRGFVALHQSSEMGDARRELAGESDSQSVLGDNKDEPEIGRGSPDGLTDLMVRAKYRFTRGEWGHFSAILGATVPTGKSNVLLDSGERLEPSSQPGTGRLSALGGIAYSRFLTARIRVDASWVYTRRFERDSFRVGSRDDAGVAIAYRVNESVEAVPRFSPFLELTHQYIGRDRASGVNNINSGGRTLFLTPGVKVGLTRDIGVVIAPMFPVEQELNGEQLQAEFRLVSSVFASF